MRPVDPETELLRARSELAGLLFEAALLRASILERKANFNPNQPRDPADGRWVRDVGRVANAMREGLQSALHGLPEPIRRTVEQIAAVPGRSLEAVGASLSKPLEQISGGLEAAIERAPPPVRAFLARNRETITRSLGALQMAGGVGEIAAGADVAVESGGLATAAGAWMVAHGIDDWDAGLRMLVSGKAQENTLSSALQGFGFSRQAADGLLAASTGLPASQLAGMTRREIEAVSDRVLTREALEALAKKGAIVTHDGRPLWDIVDITARGDTYEQWLAKLTNLRRTPVGFKTFDLVSEDRLLAVSVKTLDLQRDFYLDTTRKRVEARLKSYIDAAADFRKSNRRELPLLPSDIQERRLELGLPAGRATPGQQSQIKAAQIYATSRGVNLAVRYLR